MKKTVVLATMLVAAVFLVGMSSQVFAGRNGGGCWRNAPYNNPEAGDGGCMGGKTGLTEEQVKQVNELRQAFFDSTRDIRQQIYEKKMQLKSLMAPVEPDPANVRELQGQLSELKAQFDQKRIDHILQMKKINPYAGRGCIGNERACYQAGPRAGGPGCRGGGHGFDSRF